MPPTEAARMAESIRAYWGSYAKTGPRHYETDGGATLIWSGIPSPVFNSVILEHHDPDATARTIARLSALIASQGIEATWHVAPEAAAAGALDALREVCPGESVSAPAMIAPLDGFPDPGLPDGLEIVEMHGGHARHGWILAAAEGFGFDADTAGAIADCEADIPEDALEGQVRYTGLLDGEPVAASSLVMAAGFAGIFAVSTKPAARGRGIGAAMTAHAMREGRRRGAREAALQASDMGFPVYERLGFRTAFPYLRLRQPAPA